MHKLYIWQKTKKNERREKESYFTFILRIESIIKELPWRKIFVPSRFLLNKTKRFKKQVSFFLISFRYITFS